MAKVQNIWKGLHPYESWFSHRYACWASNHRGWAKMKAFNRKLAKRKLRQRDAREIRTEAN